MQDDYKNVPFKLVSDEIMNPQMKVKFKGKEQVYYPEQISGFLLS